MLTNKLSINILLLFVICFVSKNELRMPSILYSTTCFIKNDFYRLRIYVDEKYDYNEIISSEFIQSTSDSLEFTSTNIPIHHIQPSFTRLHFELLNKKKANNNIPETITLNHLLDIKQTNTLPRNYYKNVSNSFQADALEASSRTTSSIRTTTLEQSGESSRIILTPNDSKPFVKRRQLSFRRFFSSSSNSDSEAILLFRTLIKIKYIDVSNSIQWNIKCLELEMDTEDIANELYRNLTLCLSTLKQRPRRLLAFINPLSGKGMKNILRNYSLMFLYFIVYY